MTLYSARFLDGAGSVEASVWDLLANPAAANLPHPFTRHAFFAALEDSGSANEETGWRPMHLLLERRGKPAALLPLYRKTHSYGEYVFDHAWAEAFMRAGGRYYPKLQASVPFTAAPGPRLLIAAGENQEEASDALLKAGIAAVRETRSSSLHITFMREEAWQRAGQNGFLLRTDQQFHWENQGYESFDGFLAALSSSKRKNLRKERAAVAADGVTFAWLTGSDLTETVWDEFFECYVATGSQKWNSPYLTREFFSRVGASMGEQIALIMAKRGERTIAGALNFFDEETLYGRNWGATDYVPFLHFEACYYQAIDFAIAKGLKRVEAGAQGSHKLLRGYLPSPTYSAHYIAHEGLRRAVGDYLEHERADMARQRIEMTELAPFKKGG